MYAKKGFTLLELMVTIVVVAILAAIAIPNFRQAIQNSTRDAVLSNLNTAMNYARNAALRNDVPVVVCPLSGTTGRCGGNWNQGWIITTKPANASTVVLMTDPALRAGGPVISVMGSGAAVVFSPRGLVTGQDTYTVCDNRGAAYAKALEINITGYIQISATAGELPDGGTLTCP